MSIVHPIELSEWSDPVSSAVQHAAVDALESGSVLFLPKLRFELNESEREFLTPNIVGKSKNGLFTCNIEREPLIRDLWLIMRRQSRESLPTKTVANYISFTFDDESKLFQ